MIHYTDKDGYDSIRSQPTWRFKAPQPPGDHPFGAYFTTLTPDTKNLAKRLGVPRRKLAYRFEFTDVGDLTPLPGDRGEYIFYSATDYDVLEDRQQFCGETGL